MNMLHALFSSLTSKSSSKPFFLRYFAPIVAISIRFSPFFSRPVSERILRYRVIVPSMSSLMKESSTSMLSNSVVNVVWRQWSLQ